MKQNVAILGASDRPDRYAYMAMKMLMEYGHSVYLVNPQLTQVEGLACVPSLSDVKVRIETLTLYVNPKISSQLKKEILALNPQRVIFNPGTENSELEDELSQSNISCVEACTLVMLKTNQFEKALVL